MGGFMTDKGFCIEFIDEKPIGAVGERFNYDYHDEKIIDNQTGKTYDGDNYHMLVIDGLLNQLNNENEQLKIALKDKENLISICEKKFKELGYLITCDDDGYVIE
jgi:hypothetical protein